MPTGDSGSLRELWQAECDKDPGQHTAWGACDGQSHRPSEHGGNLTHVSRTDPGLTPSILLLGSKQFP